ncbi:MAG TPA: energy transducer TonB [Verrucomicrobiae bacterium]|nr:energy transducer TonB [Verrucomicrobiae bacterium]
MSATAARTLRWPFGRWVLMIALAVLAQAGLIFWFGDYSFPPARKPAAAPVLQVAANSGSELLALNDPTLFALPNARSFAGLAWMRSVSPSPPSSEVPDKPFWLEVPIEKLGNDFSRFIDRQRRATPLALLEPNPSFTAPPLAPPPPLLSHSTLLLAGPVASRSLVSLPPLPAWPASDLLTNSVVEVSVTPQGDVLSAALIASSTSREADETALQEARNARFESTAVYGPGRPLNLVSNLTRGDMIFEWRTLPMPSTNSSPSPPR